MSGLSIGILVDSLLKHQNLSKMVAQAHHCVGYAYILTQGAAIPTLNQKVDAWVVDVNQPDESTADSPHAKAVAQLLDALVEQTQVPVIVNDGNEFAQGSAEQSDWIRRTLQRIERLEGDVKLQARGGPSEVWVLGASSGGPAAVKDFIASLPPNLDVAFIYVQHIHQGQLDTLVKMMSSAGVYPATIVEKGSVLTNNTISVVSAERSVSIFDNGTLAVSQHPWRGGYSPSIDQVATNVARIYRQRSGMIVFSGMGDDGAAGSRLIQQLGGKVWSQAPEQSAIRSMPDAAIATGSVSFVGAPEELARALSQRHSVPSLTKISRT